MDKKIILLRRQIKSVLKESPVPLNATNVATLLKIEKRIASSLLMDMRKQGKIHAYPAGYYSTRRRAIPLDRDRNAVIQTGDSISIKNTDITITLKKAKEEWIYSEKGYIYSFQLEISAGDIVKMIHISSHEHTANHPQEFSEILPGYRFIFSNLKKDSIQVEIKRQ